MEAPRSNMTFEERVAYIEENWPILLLQDNFILSYGHSPLSINYLRKYCEEPRKHKDQLDTICSHIYNKSRIAQQTIGQIMPLIPE